VTKKHRLNCHDGKKCGPNERMWISKFEFEHILIFSICWSSSDPNCWKCSGSESTELF